MGHILTMLLDIGPNPKCPMGIHNYSMQNNYTMMGV